jgi:hypothetical protein
LPDTARLRSIFDTIAASDDSPVSLGQHTPHKESPMKTIARLVVAATAIVSIAGMAAPATAAPKDVQQRNVWCC